MTRFLMTLDDSVTLIETALRNGQSGETWIPKLPAMNVGDLAEIFSERYNKPIKIIGLRPGEKKDEDLINESESIRTRQEGNYYIIGPAYNAGSGKRFVYSSIQNVMHKNQLFEHLCKLGILDASLDQFKGLTIEEIVTNRKA
jgi:FlaA1/EpsC-like NDP-sugar epimerase